jgi:hypothetical protein
VWGDLLRREGFLVIMPNSFARWGRMSNCDGRAFQGYGTSAIFQTRMMEIEYALAEIDAMRPSPPRVFLMGQSEGGYATQFWHSGGFDGYVIAATTCRYTNLPHDAPTLIVRYTTDPWDGRGGHWCADMARNRPDTQLHLVDGHGHDPASDRAAQIVVIEFLKRVASLPAYSRCRRPDCRRHGEAMERLAPIEQDHAAQQLHDEDDLENFDFGKTN